MTNDKSNLQDATSFMATVAAIVEAVSGGQRISLYAQHSSPWKAAQREEMVANLQWRSVGWGRA